MIKLSKERGVRPILHDWVDNLFGRDEDFFKGFAWFNKTTPAVNIFEKPDKFFLELAVPGMEKKDFHVTIDNGVLEIKAEKEMMKEEEEKMWARKEFNYFNFKRTFMLPENVLVDKIQAKYENGLLRIMLPKVEVEVKKAKEILIEN